MFHSLVTRVPCCTIKHRGVGTTADNSSPFSPLARLLGVLFTAKKFIFFLAQGHIATKLLAALTTLLYQLPYCLAPLDHTLNYKEALLCDPSQALATAMSSTVHQAHVFPGPTLSRVFPTGNFVQLHPPCLSSRVLPMYTPGKTSSRLNALELVSSRESWHSTSGWLVRCQ